MVIPVGTIPLAGIGVYGYGLHYIEVFFEKGES